MLVAAMFFAGLVFYTLLGSEPVKVTNARLVRSGGRVSAEGEVHNSGDDSGPLQVEVRYYDREGRAVGEEVVSIDGLRRGDTAHFSTPARVDQGVADFSIYLNHGRNPYGN